MEDLTKDDTPKLEYQGYKIPFVIKLAWVLLIVWIITYSILHVLPDLALWLSK